MLVLAVNRYEELRLCKSEHQLEFFLTSVSGNVDLVHSLIYDLGTGLHKLVYDSRYELFVAGDRCSRNDDEVHRRDVDLFVVVHSHSGESGHRLALTSGGDEDYPFTLIEVHHFDVYEYTVRNVEVAELDSGIDDIYHTSAEYSDFSAVADSAVYDLLDSVYI